MNIFINYSLNIHLFTLFLIPYYLIRWSVKVNSSESLKMKPSSLNPMKTNKKNLKVNRWACLFNFIAELMGSTATTMQCCWRKRACSEFRVITVSSRYSVGYQVMTLRHICRGIERYRPTIRWIEDKLLHWKCGVFLGTDSDVWVS